MLNRVVPEPAADEGFCLPGKQLPIKNPVAGCVVETEFERRIVGGIVLNRNLDRLSPSGALRALGKSLVDPLGESHRFRFHSGVAENQSLPDVLYDIGRVKGAENLPNRLTDRERACRCEVMDFRRIRSGNIPEVNAVDSGVEYDPAACPHEREVAIAHLVFGHTMKPVEDRKIAFQPDRHEIEKHMGLGWIVAEHDHFAATHFTVCISDVALGEKLRFDRCGRRFRLLRTQHNDPARVALSEVNAGGEDGQGFASGGFLSQMNDQVELRGPEVGWRAVNGAWL